MSIRILTLTLILLVAIGALNLIWLGTSTVRIQNASDAPVDEISWVACETPHPVGTLEPGGTIFRFLEACGDDTLEILVGDLRFCQIYVEGDLYHVDAVIKGADRVDCTYDDLFSTLLVKKALW